MGAGVYASHLMDSLLNLNIKGLPGSEYVFLNVETGVYLYHEDETLLNTSTTESGYLEILRRIQEDGGTQANTYSYRDEAGVRQLVVYKYLRDRGWVFMVRDNATEVYGAVTMVRVLVGVMCAVTAAAVILITLLILRREGRELMVVERAIGRLGDLKLSADQELEPFYGRSDEIGMIAQTTHGVCSCCARPLTMWGASWANGPGDDRAGVLRGGADGERDLHHRPDPDQRGALRQCHPAGGSGYQLRRRGGHQDGAAHHSHPAHRPVLYPDRHHHQHH